MVFLFSKRTLSIFINLAIIIFFLAGMKIIEKQISSYTFQLTVLCLIGLVLRIYKLDSYSLWNDEMFQTVVASSEWTEFLSLIKMHSSPPIDYIFGRIAKNLFGNADWVVRLPAFLFGVASIPLFYFLCRTLTGCKTALVAVTNVFSLFICFFSQLLVNTGFYQKKQYRIRNCMGNHKRFNAIITLFWNLCCFTGNNCLVIVLIRGFRKIKTAKNDNCWHPVFFLYFPSMATHFSSSVKST